MAAVEDKELGRLYVELTKLVHQEYLTSDSYGPDKAEANARRVTVRDEIIKLLNEIHLIRLKRISSYNQVKS